MPTKLLCLFFALSMNLGCALLAHAEHCSVEGKTEGLENFYSNAVRTTLLKSKLGFTIEPNSLELDIHPSTNWVEEENQTKPVLEINGTIMSTTGTKFKVTAKSPDFYVSTEYTTVRYIVDDGSVNFDTRLLSRGTDRQGNPIHPACRLTTDATLSVTNEKWNRTIAKFKLPSTFTVNLE